MESNIGILAISVRALVDSLRDRIPDIGLADDDRAELEGFAATAALSLESLHARIKALAKEAGLSLPEDIPKSAYDVWVDFNDLDPDGTTTTLLEYVNPDVCLDKGVSVVAGDGDGNRADATVLGQDRGGGMVWLRVDLKSFKGA